MTREARCDHYMLMEVLMGLWTYGDEKKDPTEPNAFEDYFFFFSSWH